MPTNGLFMKPSTNHSEALTRILHQIKYLVSIFYFAVFSIENWINASGVQPRNPFSHTVCAEIARVNYVKETPKSVLRLLYIKPSNTS